MTGAGASDRLNDNWGPGIVGKMTCPWHHCLGIVDVVRHAPSSDKLDELVDTLAPHPVIGPNSWYGACPASYLLVPLSDRGRQNLDEHDVRFEVWLRERLGGVEDSVRSRRARERQAAINRRVERQRRRGTLGHLDVPPEMYFPPRPSDVEEVEGLPVPKWADLHQFTGRGGSNVTSANDQTINLINLAKQTVSNAQEDCSASSHIVDLLDAKIKSVNEHLAAAGQLVAAAAMGSATNPRLVDESGTMIAAASNHIDDAEARLAGVSTKVTDAFNAAHHAIEKLDEFIRQISA